MTEQQQCSFVLRLLALVAKHHATDELLWNEDLEFSVLCSDFFSYGTADAEDITHDDLPALEEALRDAGKDGMGLYCARRRGMRPQGGMYRHLEKENRPLFDACGPKREIRLDNPFERWGL